jgi:hypothetical protein
MRTLKTYLLKVKEHFTSMGAFWNLLKKLYILTWGLFNHHQSLSIEHKKSKLTMFNQN